MCKARLPLPDFSEHPADASNAAAWQCLQCGCIPSAGPESLLMVFFVSRQTIQLVFDYNGRERRPSSPGLALSCKSAMHPRHTSSGNHVIVACPSSFDVSALHVPLSYIVACSHSLWASCSRQEGLRCISLCSHASTSPRGEGSSPSFDVSHHVLSTLPD